MPACFEIKASMQMLPVIKLLQFNISAFNQELGNTIQRSPNFFKDASVIMEIQENLTIEQIQELTNSLEKHKLKLVGFKTKVHDLQKLLQQHQFIVFHDTKVDNKPKAAESKPKLNMLITNPVRSGQQIHAAGDLIIVAPVSVGAEILAEGNIHVYGTLRGRALAGITGDTSARIFCQQFEAELIAIAGTYLLSEQFEKYQKQAVQIYLENQLLQIKKLDDV